MSEMITPPAMIGILGGGPTVGYFERAAQRMGFRTLVLDPSTATRTLRQAASACSVITTVDLLPTTAMRKLSAKSRLCPSAEVVELCTDRLAAKRFLHDLGVAVGPFMTIESADDIDDAADSRFPAILKSRLHGNGRSNQVRVANHDQLAAAWQTLAMQPCVLEQRLTVGRELALVVARTADGRVACFPVSQQQYIRGVLEISYAPASLMTGAHDEAAALAEYIATELGLVGVLAVHMFVVGHDVYVHELTPRPCALGLFTLDACRTDQYEQQVRAVCGLALGEASMVVPGVAVVGLGSELWATGEPQWKHILVDPTARLHRYEVQVTGDWHQSTMGHLAACSGTAAGSTSVVRKLRKQLTGR
ncbi:MAG: ATP-grasp domain-containing protein [Actinobacteria bacterium]|nr:ATP-grasp domain-containing protein [Actinomycetota bacterium]